MRRAPEIGLDEQNSSFWHLKAQKPINFCAKNVQVSESSGFPTAIFERAVLMRQPVLLHLCRIKRNTLCNVLFLYGEGELLNSRDSPQARIRRQGARIFTETDSFLAPCRDSHSLTQYKRQPSDEDCLFIRRRRDLNSRAG